MGARVGAQKRLTNIALVKYKKHGHKFELACYRNTVMAWRNKACAPSLCSSFRNRCSSFNSRFLAA
jgi:hypothetical protein